MRKSIERLATKSRFQFSARLDRINRREEDAEIQSIMRNVVSRLSDRIENGLDTHEAR